MRIGAREVFVYRNSNGKNNSVIGGIGFIGLLTIAFIVLKLCGVIKWSWIWVLSPLWIEFAICIVILLVAIRLLR